MNNAAYTTGMITGMVIFGLLLLIGLGVGIWLIVMAARKRTTGWIVGGVLGGLLLVGPSLLFGLGLLVAMAIPAFQAVRENSLAAQAETALKSGDRTQLQHLVGASIPYELFVPKTWTPEAPDAPQEFIRSSGDVGVVVVPEEVAMSSRELSDYVLELTRKEEGVTIIRETHPVTVNGLSFFRLELHRKLGRKLLRNLIYSHVRENGQSVRLIFVAPVSQTKQTDPLFEAVANTFSFTDEPLEKLVENLRGKDATKVEWLVGAGVRYTVSVPKGWQQHHYGEPTEHARSFGNWQCLVMPESGVTMNSQQLANWVYRDLLEEPDISPVSLPEMVIINGHRIYRCEVLQQEGSNRLRHIYYCAVRPDSVSIRFGFSVPAAQPERTALLINAILHTFRWTD